MSPITAEHLRATLSYDPETGVFSWLRSMGDNRVRAGDLAGLRNRSGWYPRIRIDDRLYYAHRLAWLWMTGSWPPSEMDHINCDRGDNRWNNLRLASHAQNNWNKKHLGTANGLKGASFHKHSGLWHARIRAGGTEISLGYFQTERQAHEAYAGAALTHHKQFARPEWTRPKQVSAP